MNLKMNVKVLTFGFVLAGLLSGCNGQSERSADAEDPNRVPQSEFGDVEQVNQSNTPASSTNTPLSSAATTEDTTSGPSISDSSSSSSADDEEPEVCMEYSFARYLKVSAGQWHLDALDTRIACPTADPKYRDYPEIYPKMNTYFGQDDVRCMSPRTYGSGWGEYGNRVFSQNVSLETSCFEYFAQIQYWYPGHYWYDGDIIVSGSVYCCQKNKSPADL